VTNRAPSFPDDDESGGERTINTAAGGGALSDSVPEMVTSPGFHPPAEAQRPSFGRYNTPTAFTPQPLVQEPASPKPPAPPSKAPPVPRKPQMTAELQPVPPGPVPAPPVPSSMRSPPMMAPQGPPSQLAPAQPVTSGFGSSVPGLPGGPSPSGPPPSSGPMHGFASGMQPLHAPPPPNSATPPGGQSTNAMSMMASNVPTSMGMQAIAAPPPQPHMQQQQAQGLALRTDTPRELRSNAFHVMRSRAYSFVLDARGMPIELGSGRFAKAYLGEERWLESKTDFRREIVIKILQKGVSEEDHMRFQMEKELLERVQGHPNIVELFASGEGEDIAFLPPSIRDKVDPEFMILERLEMSLEERLKGSRSRGQKDDLLAFPMHERMFRVLDYLIPIASAVEYAHLVRNVVHRDIKPANVLIKTPDPNLRGSTLEVRLADFNVAKLQDDDVQFGMTSMKGAVPGTLFFQSPEQETNVIELLVNTQQGVPEVEYFEDFYIQIAKNDSFSLFNRGEQYPILYADRARKRIVLGRPYRDVSEMNVRARIQKSVGRPADIYSLGATLYYLISGAYANPKTLYDAFHKFIEYERADENNTIEAYLRHEYEVINSLRAPKTEGGQEVAPADRFFTYKHYLDGNGELIDPNVMLIIAKCMIRNKPDSYCQAHDLETRGISELVTDLHNVYAFYGVHPAARPMHLVTRHDARRGLKFGQMGDRLRILWRSFLGLFTGRR